jgi:hypothetical protein
MYDFNSLDRLIRAIGTFRHEISAKGREQKSTYAFEKENSGLRTCMSYLSNRLKADNNSTSPFDCWWLRSGRLPVRMKRSISSASSLWTNFNEVSPSKQADEQFQENATNMGKWRSKDGQMVLDLCHRNDVSMWVLSQGWILCFFVPAATVNDTIFINPMIPPMFLVREMLAGSLWQYCVITAAVTVISKRIRLFLH